MGVPTPIFFIGEIKIGTVSDASCINIGNNWPTQFESHKKHNQGFGSIIGDNNAIDNIRTLLNDPDFIEMVNETEEGGLPPWMENLLQEAART